LQKQLFKVLTPDFDSKVILFFFGRDVAMQRLYRN